MLMLLIDQFQLALPSSCRSDQLLLALPPRSPLVPPDIYHG
jgi:hypothetical protein